MFIPLEKRYIYSSSSSCTSVTCHATAVVGFSIFLFVACLAFSIFCTRVASNRKIAENRRRRTEEAARHRAVLLRDHPNDWETSTDQGREAKPPAAFPTAHIPPTPTQKQRTKLQRRERRDGTSQTAATGQTQQPHLTIEVLSRRDSQTQKDPFTPVSHSTPPYVAGNDALREPPPAYQTHIN